MINILTYPRRKNQSEEININISCTEAVRKLRAIAEREGVDAECLIFLAIVRLVRENWDWSRNNPIERRDTA